MGALQAARSGIVDVTSFDYVTLDDDIEQIRDVDHRGPAAGVGRPARQQRQQLTDAQAVVNTTVVGAAVGQADDDSATVFAVIQSTQKTKASRPGAGAALPGGDRAAARGRPVAAVRDHRTVSRR